MPKIRGAGFFKAGAIGLVVFGAVHMLAVYQANFTTPEDPKLAEIQAASKAYAIPMGPFRPSGWGGMQILNASYSILLMYAGVLNLLVLGPIIAAGRLRSLTVCNLIFVGLLFLVTVIFQFPPPVVFAGLIVVFFALSLIRARTTV